jgi:hypothetical protein
MNDDQRSGSGKGCSTAIALLGLGGLTCMGIAATVAWLFEPAAGVSFGVGVAVTLGLIMGVLLAFRAYSSSHLGNVLYDCGGRDDKMKYLRVSLGWLLFGLAFVGLGAAFDLPFFAIAIPAYAVLQAVLNGLKANDRFLVSEQGILGYGMFICWDRVLAYRLEGDGTLMLQIQGGKQVGPVCCRLPPNEIPALDLLLNERTGTKISHGSGASQT